jgi:hypothetical protein
VDEELLRSIVATLRAVWPHVRLYELGSLLMAASDRPFALAEQAVPALLEADPGALARLGVLSPTHLEAWLLLDDAAAEEFARGAPVVTDDRNLLQMRSPHVAGGGLLHQEPRLLRRLEAIRSAPASERFGRIRRMLEQGRGKRALALLPLVDDPAGRWRLQAAAALQRGERRNAGLLLRSALRADPADAHARALVLRDARRSGAPLVELDAGSAGPAERVVREAAALADAERLAEVRRLDAALAAVPVDDPFFADAAELRAAWRVRIGGADAQRDARRLIEGLLTTQEAPTAARLLLAESALRDGDPLRVALALEAVAGDSRTLPLSGAETERFRALTAALPEEGELAQARERLAAYLDAAPRSSDGPARVGSAGS